jgi:hypothetical protein
MEWEVMVASATVRNCSLGPAVGRAISNVFQAASAIR